MCLARTNIYIKMFQEYLTGQERLVCEILKSLYNLKQAKRLWNKTIIKFFQKIGFISTNTDTFIFIIKRKEEFVIVRVYIADFAFKSKSLKILECLKD